MVDNITPSQKKLIIELVNRESILDKERLPIINQLDELKAHTAAKLITKLRQVVEEREEYNPK